MLNNQIGVAQGFHRQEWVLSKYLLIILTGLKNMQRTGRIIIH